MATTRKVLVQAISDRTGKAYAANKPFVVRWTVGGRPKSRAFAKRPEADIFRGRLLTAIDDREVFDTETGEPVSWAPAPAVPAPDGGVRFIAHAVEHVELKWKGWKPKSRGSAIEGLVIAACTLVDEPLPKGKRESVRSYLVNVAFNPPALAEGLTLSVSQEWARDWLAAHSLPMADIRARHAEVTLTAMATRLDGGSVSSPTLRRRRSALSNCLKRAVRDDLMVANPVPLVEQTGPEAPQVTRVEKTALPGLEKALEFCRRMAAHGREGRRYPTFFLVILLSGLRPSEVALLHEVDLHLPESGWGSIKVWGGTVVAGRRYTETDRQWADQDQKWRDASAPPRTVPIPPRLVAALREFIVTFGVADDGRVFVNSRGNPLTPNNTGSAWRSVRQTMWPAARDAQGKLRTRRFQPAFFDLVPYDFRHIQASLLLAAPGISDAEAARRLGHSVDMLRKVYAAWFEDDSSEGNDAMDEAYGDLLSA